MLNICDEIEEVKTGYANMAYKYAKDATFGEKKEALFYDMARLSFYIKVMERNMPIKSNQKINISLQGQKISLSSLKKQNNNLILDIRHLSSCIETEYRSCLSDEVICKIVERAKILCYGYT